jgi:hypothetical protein
MDKLPPVVQKTWLKVRNWPVTPPDQTGQK